VPLLKGGLLCARNLTPWRFRYHGASDSRTIE